MKIAIVPTAAIPPQAWDEIWQLTQRYYDCERDYAEARLKERQLTALVRAGGDCAMVGMASIDVIGSAFRGRAITALYTSHVLLREDVRGRNLIQKIGLRVFLAERLRHPLRPIYWFFDTFSYKSYLLLPRNYRDFWPRFDRPTPASEQALMDSLARQIYGPAWQPVQGIVVRSGKKRLRAETAPLAADFASSPDLAFFAARNPGHAEGDMLVCLCPLTAANWLHAIRLALGRTWRRNNG